MTHRIALIAILAAFSAPFAVADHHAPPPSQKSEAPMSHGCCLAVQGETAHVLIAPSADAIRRIQAELAVKGFNPGPVDGVMGPRTERALRTFQRDQGLVEGLLTVETLSRLGISVQRRHQRGARGELEGAGGRQMHHGSMCGHDCTSTMRRLTRRVIRRSAPQTEQPAPEARAEQLPNYVSAFTTHEIAALDWDAKTRR
ncbi:MAG: peptidoglycan-binding domain-containing protein [Pseudomonadota bacterium]